MREKLQRFMMGRYGNDKMNQVLSYVVLVMMILGIFLRVRVCYWLAIVGVAYMYFRMLSRNISAVMRRIRLF